MSSSSPADLAVAFRSVPRRLREAMGDAPPEVTADAVAELRAAIGAAARLLGAPDEPQLLAEAIEHRHADEWDDALLDELRGRALDVGRLLRHIAALADGE